MSYEEIVTDFWARVSGLNLDCKCIAFGLALLQVRYENGLLSRCGIPNERLVKMLGVDIRTIRASRNRLVEVGIIRYEAGKAKREPMYVFDWSADPVEIPIEPAWIVEENVKDVPKEKREKKKKAVEKEGDLFAREKQRKSRQKPKEEEKPPTMDEVRAEFQKRGLSEDEAEYFYYYYDAQGWVTSSGQKIQRLDSMVNRWISNNHKNKGDGKRNSSSREERMRDAAKVMERIYARAEEGNDDISIRKS